MKILMQNRLDAFINPGGDTIQMLKTKEYLEKLGCQVDLSCELKPELQDYDLVHLFNITRVHETYLQYLNAKKNNKAIVVSPIYQNLEEIDMKSSSGIKRKLWHKMNKNLRELTKTVVRAIIYPNQFYAACKQLVVGYECQQREVLLHSDIVLPNSELEAGAIERDLNIKFKYELIPNAVDFMFRNKDDSFFQKTGLKNYVLCVANYIELKNQIALMNAMKTLDYQVVLIGSVMRTHKKYFDEIVGLAKTMGNRVTVLEKVPQNELISIYSGARVVVLPSWIETTGLACLEGALAGCNVVITDRGYAREYFKDMAFYCDPDNIQSIREAICEAYAAKPNPLLIKQIVENYTWDKTAEKTAMVYQKLLNAR